MIQARVVNQRKCKLSRKYRKIAHLKQTKLINQAKAKAAVKIILLNFRI